MDAGGEKTIGPRRELTEEMRTRAGVDIYYQYSSLGFLKYAKEYLGTEIKPQSLAQVRDVNRRAQNIRRRMLGSQAVEIIFRWVKQLHPKGTVEIKTGYPDIIVLGRDGRLQSYEV